MIWREKGVGADSYMCFFSPSEAFQKYNYYMYSCGYFQTNSDYLCESNGNRPPLFFYIIRGSMEVCCSNGGNEPEANYKTYTAHANELLLINCQHPYQYSCPNYCEFLFFHFNGPMAVTMTDYLIRSNDSPVFASSNIAEIYQTICEPVMSLCYQEQISDARLSTIIYTTLCLMQEGSTLNQNIKTNTSVSNLVQQTDAFIKKHIGDTITLQNLADECGLSPYYFARLFKKETGMAPIEYAAVTKINYAKLILRTTSASIADIAELLGYSSSASFINAFKARRGISPNQYRNFTCRPT